jgi:hypothetical protein
MKAILLRWSGTALCCVLAAWSVTRLRSVQASDRDFDTAVSAIEQNYHLHRQHIPMVGFASLCAHVATGGAVKGIRIAEFDEDAHLPEGSDMPSMLQNALGESWSMVVKSQGRNEQDAVYARPHGQRMTLLIAAYEPGEMSVVRLDMDAEHLRKWMSDPVHHAHHPDTD